MDCRFTRFAAALLLYSEPSCGQDVGHFSVNCGPTEPDSGKFEVQFVRPAWCENAKKSILSSNKQPFYGVCDSLMFSVFSMFSAVKMRLFF